MGHLPSALLSSTSGQAVLRVTVLSSECLPRVSTAYKVNLQHSKKTGHRVVTLEKALEGGTQNHSTGAVAKGSQGCLGCERKDLEKKTIKHLLGTNWVMITCTSPRRKLRLWFSIFPRSHSYLGTEQSEPWTSQVNPNAVWHGWTYSYVLSLIHLTSTFWVLTVCQELFYSYTVWAGYYGCILPVRTLVPKRSSNWPIITY